jgi:hypothetical protein
MTYKLFRHLTISGLFCAIPLDLDRSLPGGAQRWAPSGLITADDVPPQGFDPEVARFSSNFQGYYLFRDRPKDRRL